VSPSDLSQICIDLSQPTLLFSQGGHHIYWLGINHQTAFRCNAYLIHSGEHYILVDPGSPSHTPQIEQRVAQIIDPTRVTALVLCHQDPDVAASLPQWLELNPDLCVITSPRAQVLLPHYGCADYRYHDIEEQPLFDCGDGHALHFITAPHLHSPAAFTTWDPCSGFLFSGDIWAALSLDWTLVCRDFASHSLNMNMFHMDYMASNIAARGFVHKIEGLPIKAILPQHGSIIPPDMVANALHYLKHLQCGTDVLYPELS